MLDYPKLSNLETRIDQNDAILYYEEVLFFPIDINHQVLQATTLGRLGSAHQNAGNTVEEEKCYEKQLLLSRDSGFKKGEELACLGLGKILHSKCKYQDALCYLKKSLEILISMKIVHVVLDW